MYWYRHALTHSFTGHGRASRKAFWLFVLFAWLILIPFSALDDFLGRTLWVPRLYLLAIFPAFLSLTVRRLHDTGRSAGWLLLWFIPVLGWLYLFLMMIEPGDTEPNVYGDEPQIAR